MSTELANELNIPSDWEFEDADTRFLTHDIHRYSGKFVPPIARRAIELLTVPGQLVVDPYAGSGTTLLEAALTGRKSFGIDLNPLAVLITRVKVTPIERSRLTDFHDFMQALVSHLDADGTSLLAPDNWHDVRSAADNDERRQEPWFEKWYQGDVLDDLLVIDHALRAWPDQQASDLGRVAFSNVLRRSSRAHSGYPNVMFDKNARTKPRPGRHFLTSLAKVVESVAGLHGLIREVPTIVRGNATQLPLNEGVADAVVSHPPYIGSVPYAEYGALSLMWLGHDPKELDRELTGGKRQSKDVVERFTDGYGKMLAESARVVKPGGHVFVMVGSPTVKGEVIDLTEMTRELGTAAGLTIAGEATRVGMNRRANKMGAEDLLFFVKP